MRTLRADLVLRRDTAQALARAGDGGDPLGRVPTTRLLVAADLADTDGGRAEARLLCCAPEELLSYPLALAVARAVGNLGADFDGLDTGCRPGVIWWPYDENAFHAGREGDNLLRMEEIELTKSARGPPGCEELSARSSRFRAPEMSGSNDKSVTLKSTRHAVIMLVKDRSRTSNRKESSPL